MPTETTEDIARPYGLLPEQFRGGIERYLEQGIEPGSFLMAVLKNDLVDASNRACGPLSWQAVPIIIRFLLDEAPAAAYGSPELVSAWMARKKATA